MGQSMLWGTGGGGGVPLWGKLGPTCGAANAVGQSCCSYGAVPHMWSHVLLGGQSLPRCGAQAQVWVTPCPSMGPGPPWVAPWLTYGSLQAPLWVHLLLVGQSMCRYGAGPHRKSLHGPLWVTAAPWVTPRLTYGSLQAPLWVHMLLVGHSMVYLWVAPSPAVGLCRTYGLLHAPLWVCPPPWVTPSPSMGLCPTCSSTSYLWVTPWWTCGSLHVPLWV